MIPKLLFLLHTLPLTSLPLLAAVAAVAATAATAEAAIACATPDAEGVGESLWVLRLERPADTFSFRDLRFKRDEEEEGTLEDTTEVPAMTP
jgi:hypothetical protein